MAEAVTRLKLRAEDAEDLKVVSAALQSAVCKAADMAYQARERRFVVMLNRFRWESEAPAAGGPRAFGAKGERSRCGLRFDFVDAVKSVGFQPGASDRVLELLTIDCASSGDGAEAITLVFAGGAKLRLDVECVDCTLDDIGQPWPTAHRPDHAIGEPT